MKRFVEDVPYGAIPYVDVRPGEVCFILRGYSHDTWRLVEVPAGNRGRIYPTIVYTRDFDAFERELVTRVESRFPGLFYEKTLYVLRVPPDGCCHACVVCTVPAVPASRERTPCWSFVLDGFLGEDDG